MGSLIARKKAVMMMGRGSILPTQYKRVKYLESSGTQRIYTDIQGSTGVECIANVMLLPNTATDSAILGARKSSSDRIMLIHQYPALKWTLGYGSANTGLGTLAHGTKYKVESKLLKGEQLLKVDSSVVYQGTSTSDISNSFNLSIFACTYGGTSDFRMYSKARVYDLLIKQNGVDAMNCVPCIRISDSVPGMYDTVTGNFYTNSGTGQFGYEMLNGTVVSPT